MAKKHDERIQFEPEGPGSAAWRAILRQAIDGRPWLIVTRTQGGDALTRDLLAVLAGLERLDERAAEAHFDRLVAAAARLYRLPIEIARHPDRDEAVTLAKKFVERQENAMALVQAISPVPSR